MSASLAILTIGVVPMCEVLPLLTEYIDEQHITHHSLLGQMRREDVMAEYGVSPGDEPLLTLLSDHQLAHVSRQKVERSLQSIVEVLDNQGFDVILLMSTASIARLTARNSILLEPLRIIPRWWPRLSMGIRSGLLSPSPNCSKPRRKNGRCYKLHQCMPWRIRSKVANNN